MAIPQICFMFVSLSFVSFYVLLDGSQIVHIDVAPALGAVAAGRRFPHPPTRRAACVIRRLDNMP